MTEHEVRHRLARRVAGVFYLQVRAHLAQRLEQAGAQRVHPDIADRQRRSGHDQRGDAREGRGGRVARHDDVGSGQLGEAPDRYDAPAVVADGDLYIGAEGAQHVLRVVPRRLAFDHRGAARRVERGQQDRRLHLRRRHRHLVFDRQRLVRAAHQQRHAPAVARLEHGAHLRQRHDHPVHRPAAQRGVARHVRVYVLRRDQPEQQPRRRTRIAEVYYIVRAREAADAGAGDGPAVAVALHTGAQRTERIGGAQHVLRLQQAGDVRAADGAGADHQRAVRDRFVAGHVDGADDRPGLSGLQCGHLESPMGMSSMTPDGPATMPVSSTIQRPCKPPCERRRKPQFN